LRPACSQRARPPFFLRTMPSYYLSQPAPGSCGAGAVQSLLDYIVGTLCDGKLARTEPRRGRNTWTEHRSGVRSFMPTGPAGRAVSNTLGGGVEIHRRLRSLRSHSETLWCVRLVEGQPVRLRGGRGSRTGRPGTSRIDQTLSAFGAPVRPLTAELDLPNPKQSEAALGRRFGYRGFEHIHGVLSLGLGSVVSPGASRVPVTVGRGGLVGWQGRRVPECCRAARPGAAPAAPPAPGRAERSMRKRTVLASLGEGAFHHGIGFCSLLFPQRRRRP